MSGSRPVVVVRTVQVGPIRSLLLSQSVRENALIPEMSGFGPFIEDVDDRLLDLIGRVVHVRRIPKCPSGKSARLCG
jgi:hypothetical protein